MAEIEVQQADITKLEVDAIANAANTELRHGGGVAGAISRAGGPAVQAESDERAPIGLGEAVETTAGEMPCRWVIHAATMELGRPDLGRDHPQRDREHPRQGRRARREEPRAGRLRHRRRRIPARGGGPDRGRGGPPPPRAGQRARARRLRRPRGRRGGGVPRRDELRRLTTSHSGDDGLRPARASPAARQGPRRRPLLRAASRSTTWPARRASRKAHFSREFRRAFGESPHHYLLTRRLERAAALLRMTDWTRRRDLLLGRAAERRLVHDQLQARLRATPTAYRAK